MNQQQQQQLHTHLCSVQNALWTHPQTHKKALAMSWDLAVNCCRVWVSVSDRGRVGVLYDQAPAIKSAIKSQTGIISKPPTPVGRTCCYTCTPFFEARYSNLISGTRASAARTDTNIIYGFIHNTRPRGCNLSFAVRRGSGKHWTLI